jgi:hypothetical protein
MKHCLLGVAEALAFDDRFTISLIDGRLAHPARACCALAVNQSAHSRIIRFVFLLTLARTAARPTVKALRRQADLQHRLHRGSFGPRHVAPGQQPTQQGPALSRPLTLRWEPGRRPGIALLLALRFDRSASSGIKALTDKSHGFPPRDLACNCAHQ